MSKTIVIVRPGCEPAVEDLPDLSIETITRALDCEIVQGVSIGGEIMAWVDEEGMANGKPENGCGFLGTYAFTAAYPADGDEFDGLTPEQVGQCKAYWQAYRDRRHPGSSGFFSQSFDSVMEAAAHLKAELAARDQDFQDAQRVYGNRSNGDALKADS